jgi:hypothetical protein
LANKPIREINHGSKAPTKVVRATQELAPESVGMTH